MTHWLLDELRNYREEALKQASRAQIYRELVQEWVYEADYAFIRRTAEALELAVHDLALASSEGLPQATLKASAADAFRLYRVLPRPDDPIQDATQILRMCCLGVIGDMGADAARWLREKEWPLLSPEALDWRERTWATILDIWLRLIRKQGWADRDAVLEGVASLRKSQQEFEKTYLEAQELSAAQLSAVELIGLYHLAKVAEVLALYVTDGRVEGNYQIKQLLDSHFDRIFAICERVPLMDLEPLARLLAVCANQMIANSIWTVTRAVNTKVTQFVRSLVDRGRGNRAIFDVLPPQRRALAEEGLLGSSRRAVVVSLPTSSGKTLIAQFRILQALNQFELERGWVAYLAPTRTLVNQITRRMRRDFASLGIAVEMVSPALEVDNVEASLLQAEGESQFRVLVTTPEKLDLMLRQGWEEEIGRPLTLVVVDEAHNIQNPQRGLKLELLLATINNECQYAQFLLLTPFIENAKEVAQWLGDDSSDEVTIGVDWQPNDRVISIVQAKKTDMRGHNSFNYELELETIHTTRNTLVADRLLPVPSNHAIARTFREVNNNSSLAAVAAQALSQRGPVIIVHGQIPWVWSLAERLMIKENLRKRPSERVALVQEFISLELGKDFPLVNLLSYGVGVHHAGLSDEIRFLMEWLFENDELRFLVATTTIAQGVNFPITGVVMASHQYFSSREQPVDMPPEDFWNIAGRAGRIDQGRLGVVALVAKDKEQTAKLKEFINKQTGALNSALVQMALQAQSELEDLGSIVYRRPEWSSFVQYLAHTYRQMSEPDSFAEQVELVLRGTLGFETLRQQHSDLAQKLLHGIYKYADYMAEPIRPLKLVDSTGFSLQSIMIVLGNKEGISASSWNAERLFRHGDSVLRDMMGVLLQVPELKENLKAVIGGEYHDGEKLSLIIKDWVNGESVADIAARYFMGRNEDQVKAITKCGQNLYGRLAQTASWGLSALLSITGSSLPEEELSTLSNLPSKVYYGVSDDAAIPLRLLGVPRTAAVPLVGVMEEMLEQPLSKVRERLVNLSEEQWNLALGSEAGEVYRRVWRVLEGVN